MTTHRDELIAADEEIAIEAVEAYYDPTQSDDDRSAAGVRRA